MTTHVKLLGWLQILLGVVDLILAVTIFGVFAGVGALLGITGGEGAPLFGFLGTLLGGLMALTGVPNVLAGAGLLARAGWARVLALVLGVLNVFKVPWGTALALYTFWVLLSDEGRRLF